MATKKSSLFAAIGVITALLVPTGAQGVPGPDGRIAFSRQDPWTDDYDIWLVDPDGTNEVNITNTPDVSEHDPNWSPDGTKIAFSASVEDPNEPGSFFSDIFVIDADGGNRTNITATPDQSDYMPSWSPSGEEIVFAAEVPGEVITIQTDIFTIPSTGGEAIRLTFEDYEEFQPAWSPLGDKIAITAVRNGDWEILAINPDGTGEVNLTNNFTEDENSREDWAPEWSPDGSKIAFMAQYDYPCCGDWEVWAMNADGSGQTNLTNDPAGDTGPSWSPDGSEIIFASNRGDGWSSELYVMPAPTTLERRAPAARAAEPRQITTGGGTSPDWWGLAEPGRCTITGTARNDVLTGTSGADFICGGGGADRIRSGRGADVVYGGRGGDVVVGGRGPDRMFGGAGPDDIDARDDRGHDSVSGGRGVDSCQADKRDQVTGCP